MSFMLKRQKLYFVMVFIIAIHNCKQSKQKYTNKLTNKN